MCLTRKSFLQDYAAATFLYLYPFFSWQRFFQMMKVIKYDNKGKLFYPPQVTFEIEHIIDTMVNTISCTNKYESTT